MLLGQLEPPCTSNPEKVVVAGITTIAHGGSGTCRLHSYRLIVTYIL